MGRSHFGENVSFVNITSEFTFPEENVITGEKNCTDEGRPYAAFRKTCDEFEAERKRTASGPVVKQKQGYD